MSGYADYGFFFSSGKKAFSWAFFPLFILLLVYFSPFFYFKSVNKALEEEDAFNESVPILEEKINMAQTLVNGYKVNPAKADPIEMLNARMNQMAVSAGFTLNSLIIEKDTQDSAVSVFRVLIKGEGPFESIKEFFNETLARRRLLALKT
ncbi:MAG: hypothetical protein WC569_00005, partial [Candidatus Omnitrophota bacterium]